MHWLIDLDMTDSRNLKHTKIFLQVSWRCPPEWGKNQTKPEMQLAWTEPSSLWWQWKRTGASGVCGSSWEQSSQWTDNLM